MSTPLWKDKQGMLMHMGGILTLAATIIWLQIKPLGILLTLLFGVWMYKETCPGLTLVTPPELHDKLHRTYARLMAWRHDQPRGWCIIMSGGLATLALVGHIVSGSSIVVFGLVLAIVIFSRHKFSIVKVDNGHDNSTTHFGSLPVPQEHSDAFSSKTAPPPDDQDDDEFMPEANEMNALLFKHAGDEAIIFTQTSISGTEDEDNSDELPSDLAIPESIPEIDEHTDNSSDSDDDQLISSPAVAARIVSPKPIAFKSGHFKRDASWSSSSDDDEHGIAERLLHEMSTVDMAKKPATDTAPTSQKPIFAMPSIMQELVTRGVEQLVTKRIQSAVASAMGAEQPLLDSSDDSEFEMLNHDELNQMN